MDREAFEELAARVAALEKYAAQLGRATQEPLLDLLDWACEERISELGHTRGVLLGMHAAIRALFASHPDRARLVEDLDRALRQAEADALMLRLPERSMASVHEGLEQTAALLRREVAP